VEILPCAAPVLSAPNILNPNCNAYLSYSQAASPRNFMHTERLRFQSDYFEKFQMSGSLGYSSANNSVPNFNEIVNDYVTRTAHEGHHRRPSDASACQ